MPHIHTEAGQHDLTASAFIMRETGPVPELLVIRHRKLGTLMQPGGHVELDETPWQTIIHEVKEESGIDIADLMILQPERRISTFTDDAILHPIPICINTHEFKDIGHFHTDIAYAFVTKGDVTVQPDSGESQEYYWLTLEAIDELTGTEMFKNVRNIAQFALTEALTGYQRVATEQFD